MRIAIPETVVKDDLQAAATHEQILRRIEAIPGVTSVGLASSMPMDGINSNDPVWVEDKPGPRGRCRRSAATSGSRRTTSARWAATLVAGRDFTWEDLQNRRPVTILSDALAREYFGSAAAALGHRIRNSPKNAWREIVGVVGDTREDGVTKAAPPTAYFADGDERLLGQPAVRAALDELRHPHAARPHRRFSSREVQQAVWGVNPNLPLARPRTMQAIYDESMAATSFALVIIGIAAAVTLLLGFVGLYGVIAYIVAQRTREVGIRMAIGASGSQVQSMFLRRGLTLTGIGLVVGVVAAAGGMRLLSALLLRREPLRPAHLRRGHRRAGERGAAGDVAAREAGNAGGSIHRVARRVARGVGLGAWGASQVSPGPASHPECRTGADL